MLNYEQREKVKATYRPIMEDDDMPFIYRLQAAENVMFAWFFRSREAYHMNPCRKEVNIIE